MPTVSKENLMKVEEYFVNAVKQNGVARTEATVQEIADGSNVALATAHKALKELSQRGVIDIIKPSSRRFPITYIYNREVEDFDLAKSKEEQIEMLKEMNQTKDELIKELQERVRILENKLNQKNMLQNV